MWWLSFGIPAVAGGLYLWHGLSRNRLRLQLWQEALAQCPAVEVESSGLVTLRAKLTARSGPLEIRITDARGHSERVEITIEGPEGFFALKLRLQTPQLRTQEIEVGDKEFDDTFIVDGPLRPVSARLDAAMRSQLVRASFVCSPLEIGTGQIRVEVSQEKLSYLLPILLDIGRRLAEPVDVEGRIAENALRDPEAGVRLSNLLLLARERPGAPETLRVLRDACSDASPQVRLRAAIELGPESRDLLLELAESLEDDTVSAQAVSHLGSELPFERAKDILFRSLSQGLSQTARACQEVLGHHGASSGQLSLTEVEAGQLSLAPFEGGELSLAPHETEQLPPPLRQR